VRPEIHPGEIEAMHARYRTALALLVLEIIKETVALWQPKIREATVSAAAGNCACTIREMTTFWAILAANVGYMR
jgi:hypothetical protein